MIAAQVAGFEILDAYALKKVMPRLVIAIIGISLSWYIMKFAVDATNEFGNGIRAIIYAPFISAHLSTIDVNAGSNFSLTLLGGAGLFALGLVAALSFVLTALLAVLVGFGILVLRKIIIIMLILMAPFAIALSILPNTRRAWVLWRETFVKLLLMYPIIAGFIAAGRVFALTASANASNGGGLGTLGTVQTIMAIVAYFAPYFLIATAFRLAGGAVATIGGMVNDRGRGAFDGLKKYRQRSRQQNMHDFARGQRFSEDGLVGKTFGKGVNATGRYGSSVAAKRGNFGFGKRGVAVRDGQQQLAAAELEKTNQMYAAYKEDDKVQHLLSLGSEAKAKAWIDQKDAAGNYIRDDASRTAHHASLAAARSIGFNSTTRRAAIMNGANISYGLGAGEEGWQEASRTMKEIAGVSGDATDEEASQNLAYRNMMNQFQYVAKGVGRADLSGGTDGGTIEYERDAVTGKPKEDAAGNKIPVRDAQGRMKRVGYDGDRAWKSVGLYQQANGKPASIKGSGKHYVEEFKSGQSSRMEEAAVFYAELDAMLPNATGGVRDEILRQKAALQAAGVDKPIGTTQVRELDPADPNKFIYATRDVSLVDRVRGRARTYERPDPNRPTP